MKEQDNEKLDICLEPKLDLTADRQIPDDDPVNILTEAFWNQTRKIDKLVKFIFNLLKHITQ